VRSVILREQAAIHGRKTLPELGIKHFRDETQDMFVVPDVACIIYKKLSEGMLASKNDTGRCKRLFQSRLIPDFPTLIVGLMPDINWTSAVGIYMCRPNLNGVGNAWALNITDGAMPVDADQVQFTEELFEESQFDDEQQQNPTHKKRKFKPKRNDKDIGESSEEAGSGGSTP
ncbi:MAG TPA: hypothetical protein VKV04_03755, partial [Verrucomicrobiae bacterium]|nr:hypothetical protein [Verrucomicrobiae bacterium]